MSSIKLLVALCTVAIFNGALALGPPAVNLRTAKNFAVLAKTGVSTVPNSAITGAVGISPSAATFLTGFSQTIDSTGAFSTSTQVVGKIFATNYAAPTPVQLSTAVADMQTAFLDANGRILPNSLNLGAGTLSGLTLTPGLYKWTTGVSIPTDLVLAGTALDTFIFQVAGTLTMAANKKITLVGVLASNIVWVVTTSVSLGAGAHFEGVVLAGSAINFVSGSSINGRLLSQSAVALQKATVVAPLL